MEQVLPPAPGAEDEQQRPLQASAALREAFIDEAWAKHLRDALAAFYSAETLMRFSVFDTSRNLALYAWNAQNTLYEDTPTVSAGSTDPDVLALVATPQLWAQRSTAQLRAIATGEGCIRVDIEGERATYRRVGVDRLELWPDPATPGQPGAVRETRLRVEGNEQRWTRELWDPKGIASGQPGTFRIETYDGKDWLVSTDQHWPGLEGRYPYTEGDTPLLPYVLVHHRPSTVLRTPDTGAGLVAVTLGVGCMHTFWIHGIRDHAHPQPTMIDLVPVGTVTDPMPGVQPLPVQVLRRDPSSPWLMRSTLQTGGGTLTSLGSSMDPLSTLQAIDAYAASALRDAGLGPTDEAPAKGVSGVAISISREALRRSQRQQRPAAEEADRLILVLAGRMLRGRGTVPLALLLPSDPSAYAISYHGIQPSDGELLVSAQRQQILLAAGLTERWRAIMAVHPHLSERDAREMATRIEAAARPAPAQVDPPTDPPHDSPDDPQE